MRWNYTPSDRARFWAKVDKTGDCWLWTASRGKDGYGRLQMGGHGYVRAHVMSYEIHSGSLPTGLWVLHHCDTPACVRPDHLYAGTAAQNSADRNRRGRHAYGTRVNTAKLTADDVRTIRQRYAAGGITQKALAAEYGVAKAMVFYIVTRQSWAHVE